MLCAIALLNGEPLLIECETEGTAYTDAPLERIFFEVRRE